MKTDPMKPYTVIRGKRSILFPVFFLFISILIASISPTGAWAANGDINGDGVVNAADVLLAQRIAMGLVTAMPDQLSRGDVAPISAPDGVINAADVVVIQRIAMGLISTYTITASAGANGTISPSGVGSVISGATVTFTITPTNGYHVANVLVDGVSKGMINSYTFTNVAANHTITASFAITSYTITATADANGAISPSGLVTVNSGATVTFTMTPHSGYSVADVVVDSVSHGTITSYPFTNVTATHTIAASFAANDTTPPTGSIVINNGAAYTKSSSVTLTLNATDSGSGVSQMQFSNDGLTWSTPEPFATSTSWSLTTGDGTKTVFAKFKDSAGNWMTVLCSSLITLDTTPPTVAITSPTAGNTNSRTPTLTYTMSDGIVVVKVDGIAVNKVSGNNLDRLSFGAHTVQVESTDVATNTGQAEVTFTVVTTQPTVTISSPSAGPTANTTPLLTYSVNTGTVKVKVDGVVVNNVLGSPLGPLSDGMHSVLVEATDTGGNTGRAQVFFAVDTAPPAATLALKFWKIDTGGMHSTALAVNGTLWAGGSNSYGQIGDGTGWAAVSAGIYHTVALKSDGTLWAWGDNTSGWLGDGSNVDRPAPVQIGADTDWFAVSAGGFDTNSFDGHLPGSPYAHTVALKSDGTLWAWGNNNAGQLGDGTWVGKNTPVQIGTETKWTAISAGGMHTIALKSDGSLWAWGSNDGYQLGDGGGGSSLTPERIGTDTNWIAISAGGMHTAALKSDGSLWTWGYNMYYEVGDGSTQSRFTPARTGTANNWVAVSAGAYYTMALKSDGTLWGWGYENYGQIGAGSGANTKRPCQIGTASDWKAVSAGHYHTVALKSDGALWAWGLSPHDPVNDVLGTNNPIVINNGANFTLSTSVTLSLSAFDAASYVAFMKFSNDGSTWSGPVPYGMTKAWTLNPGDGAKTVSVMFQDAVGHWSTVYSASIILDTVPPTVTITSPVPGFTNNNMPLLSYTVNKGTVVVKVDGIVVNKISGNSLDALADSRHTVRVEATDVYGLMGFAEKTFTVDTVPPTGITNLKFAKAAAGAYHALAITSKGTLWAWGGNWSGQLGDGTIDDKHAPVQIGIDENWAAISAGQFHTVAVKSDGTLWAWGSSSDWYGVLGDGTKIDKHIPTRIGTDTNWGAIAAGYLHTLALKSDGSLWAWGCNLDDQLGLGVNSSAASWVPVRIGTDTNWTAIAAGWRYSVALYSNGTLWAWGNNSYGQMGGGSNFNIGCEAPIRVGPDADWTAVSAGGAHVVALKSNGTLWSWGYNVAGQLGDGTNSDKYIPAQIGTDTNWTAISAGSYHTVALKSDGALWEWGNGIANAPLRVGSDANWIAIFAGDQFTLALKSDGTLWAWGTNPYGQLGDGTIQSWPAPHLVKNAIGAGNSIVINNGANSTISAAVTLQLFSSDETSGVAFMKFSNDGTTWTTPEPYATTRAWTLSPGEGVKTVFAMFQDNAGNWSPPCSSSIIYSTGMPTVTITSPTIGVTNNKTPMLSYTVSGGTVVVKVDGVVVNKVSGNKLDSLPDGAHTVRVEATNGAGTSFAAVTFTVDTVAPTVTITSPSAGTTNNKTPVLTYTVSEGPVVVKVDGVVVDKVSGNALDALTNGSHTVRVEAKDAANNTGFAEVTFTVAAAVAPTVNIISPTGYTNSNTPFLAYTVSGGAVVVKVDGIVVNKVSGSALDFLTDGSHTVRVEAVNAGITGFAEANFTVSASSGNNDDSNVYCTGPATYPVGPSDFTYGITVPSSNNVLIASPTNGATINNSKAIIKGAMDNTVPVMGVVVTVINSAGTGTYPVAVNGKYFAAQVPLAADTNTITVIATDQNNAKHQANITVTGVMQSNNVELQAAPSAGIPTLKATGQTTLDVALMTSASLTTTVANYAWDFNGTGANSLICYSHSNVIASYEQVGLYLTTVTVTDTAGNNYNDTVIVNVVDRAAIDALLKANWEGMKGALSAGDTATALTYIAPQSQQKFSDIFTALQSSISQLAAAMQKIELITINDGIAKYRIKRDQVIDGQNRTMTYYIYMMRDQDGKWKISDF